MIITELTRYSRIFLAATEIGSEGDTIATLETKEATKLGNKKPTDKTVKCISLERQTNSQG